MFVAGAASHNEKAADAFIGDSDTEIWRRAVPNNDPFARRRRLDGLRNLSVRTRFMALPH
jgi:hypothetical protein